MARQWQLPGSDHRGSLHCVILYVFLLVTLIFCTNIPPSTAMSNILNPCTSLKCLKPRQPEVESSWNVMAHGDARVEKWRANKRMEWVTSKRHMTAENTGLHEQCKSCRLMCTARLPVVDWTDAPADCNGLVRFAERQNLVSARVPSHFKRSLPPAVMQFKQLCFTPDSAF